MTWFRPITSTAISTPTSTCRSYATGCATPTPASADPPWTDEADERAVSRARAATCTVCPVQSACPRSKVSRSFHAEELDRVRSYRGTAADEQALRTRSGWVEPLFAEAKQWHGLGRFRLRGLITVNIEALPVATGQNLKRWLQATGWGRRGLPGAALVVPATAGPVS